MGRMRSALRVFLPLGAAGAAMALGRSILHERRNPEPFPAARARMLQSPLVRRQTAKIAESLDLAPGMTVVYGPNEAGKSTWHAALYAGLCGMRRARGRARGEDDRFAERHRPWTGDGWGVRVRIHLKDGRDIELQHDLAGLVDCRAVDVGLGRDVSAEIINDGSPDGSRWLGLDRGAFLATACIRQAELLGIRGNPELLQEHLQRAADTGGRDETAAAALAAIEEFSSKHVGGVNLVFADGSVRFVRSVTADGPRRYAFWAMGTRSGGDSVQGLE